MAKGLNFIGRKLKYLIKEVDTVRYSFLKDHSGCKTDCYYGDMTASWEATEEVRYSR